MNFIGVDGEGYTNDEGTHLFNLLGASDGSYLHDDGGIGTRKAFDYLLSLKRSAIRKSVFVSFVFSYDVDKIIWQLSERSRRKLAQEGFVYLMARRNRKLWYRLDYRPRKWFELSLIERTVKPGLNKYGYADVKMKRLEGIKIFDTFGFFQCSFIKALETFKIGTPEERRFIESMKLLRSDFTTEGIDTIQHYNSEECRLLVSLMNRVAECLSECGIKMSSWHGAGAVASAVLRSKKVKEHFYTPTDERTKQIVMSAYFGGRVQALQVGKFDGVYGYDIVSAYPAAMRTLPSFKNCIEKEVGTYDSDYPFAIYDVEWSIPNHHPVTSLPFRNENCMIDYPYCGRAHLWQPEIEAAIKIHGPDHFTIHSGIRFDNIDLDSRPFAFIDTMFEERKRLKAVGSMAQLVLKLALNSLYGKLAQGEGYRGSMPPYQNYIYAGLITAMTRAKITFACSNSPSIVSIATDGIISTKPLSVNLSKDLGGWEDDEYAHCFVIKPGVYRLSAVEPLPDGYQGPSEMQHVTRVRGLPHRQTVEAWGDLEALWDVEGVAGRYKIAYDQFIGMKSASLNRPHGQWIKAEKELNFMPSGEKVALLTSENPLQFRVRPVNIRDGISMAYTKAAVKKDEMQDDFGWDQLD